MCDIVRWESHQKRDTVQHDIDDVGIIPYGQAIQCKRMMISWLFGSHIDSLEYLETGSSELVIFQLSKVYSNRIVV